MREGDGDGWREAETEAETEGQGQGERGTRRKYRSARMITLVYTMPVYRLRSDRYLIIEKIY